MFSTMQDFLSSTSPFPTWVTYPALALLGFHLFFGPSISDPLWLLGRARITFTSSKKTISILHKDGRKQRFIDLCRDSVPPCWLNPLLFNGHLQTLWTVVKSTDIPIYYKRHIFQAEEPEYKGQFAVDFTVNAYEGSDSALPERTTLFTDTEFKEFASDDLKPMLVILHGLSGGSHEIYLRAAIESLVKSGWQCAVVNARGCAKSKITTPVLYNARATWDVRQFVKFAKKTWPNRKIFALGFSLGANMLTNYVGEEGENCILSAAVVCSSPWELEVSNQVLRQTWIGRNVYSRAMGSSLKKLFFSHIDVLSKNSRVNVNDVRKTKFLHEFDRVVQGPTWGYPTEGAYYRDAASTDAMLAIRIPFLAISAEDDPIVSSQALPWGEMQQNPYTVMCTTTLGGHLSWFEIGGKRWFAKPVTQFLTRMAEDIKLEKIPVETGEVSSDVSIGSKPPSFYPTRHKLKMVVDTQASY